MSHRRPGPKPDPDGLSPETANIVDAFLTARGPAGATEAEIFAVLEAFSKARVTVGCFQIVGEGRGLLVDLKDGQPVFFYPPRQETSCEPPPASSPPASTSPPSCSSSSA